MPKSFFIPLPAARSVAWRVLGIGFIAAFGIVPAARAASDPQGLELFETRIRPLLSEQCYKCHSNTAEKLKGGLLLDSRETLLKGGDTGAAVVPGDVENSLLISAVRWTDKDLQMPPKHQLTPAQVSDLEGWVKAGAPWPQETGPKTAAKKIFDLQKRKQEHWCWQPLLQTPPPEVHESAWPLDPLDRFVLAKLEAKGLRPAPPAEKGALIRRASFDLIGLPPTPEETESFIQDTALDAFQKVVDRLLASPHFGERWARHWLDLVRYAETRGHEFDPDIPGAWEYRDYVVRALNADVPYNQFVAEHFAGDLMKPRLNPATGADESILGTGVWFLGEEIHSPVDIRQDEADRMANCLDVMGRAFLGLTVGCARCHDHKFDAISQRDYYALSGFLISSSYRQVRFETIEENHRIATQLEAIRGAARGQILRAISEAEQPGIARFADLLVSAARAKPAPGATPAAGSGDVTIERLGAELRAAKADVAHPLHAFAKAAEVIKTDEPVEFARVFPGLLSGWQPKPAAAADGIAPEQIVIDYQKAGAADWMEDGDSFGLHPLHSGDAVFGSTEAAPLLGISTHGCAQIDSAWKNLLPPSGSRDYGALGNWDRPGRTIRTPEVTLSHHSLWYLVRGAGRAYAAVNSHLLIAGPLHGALLHEWPSEGDRWHWVEHRLADYPGHRLHVEFSPVGQGDLAIAMVVQTDTKPPLPSIPNALIRAAIAAPGVNSLRALAETTQGVLATAARRLEQMPSGPEATDAAEVADWLVRNLDLFCPPGSPERSRLVTACQPFIAQQSALIAQIHTSSKTAPAMLEGNGVDEFLLVRGQGKAPGAQVPRRFLEALAGPNPPPTASGSGRLEFAREVVDPKNPLTARVAVNRVWHHLFGRGIVATVDNFGVLGERPSDQELLDHLTARFIKEQGWSLKKLIREIVLSRTYQMSSQPCDAAEEAADPQNLLVHRMNLRRLEGEAIRDAILTVSGRLDTRVGGPSVPVYLTPFMDGRGRPGGSGPLDGAGRRSLYQEVRRNFLSPMMLAFDTPIPFSPMGRRNVSNVPAQALILMNDPFVIEQAKLWAQHLAAISDPAQRLNRMYLAAFSRSPTSSEVADADEFLYDQSALYGAAARADERAWADLAHVLYNVKEFTYPN